MVQPPIFRLELEGMKHTLLTALADYNSDISAMAKVEVEKAIATFDFAAGAEGVGDG